MSDEVTGTAAQFADERKVEAGEGITIYVARDIPRGGYVVEMLVSYEVTRIRREVFEAHMERALEHWKSEALNVYDQIKERIAEIQMEEAAEVLT